MSYIKQTWANGETLSVTKLEHLQEGICKSNILYVTIMCEYNNDTDSNIYQSDVDYEEIKSSILAGRLVVFRILRKNSLILGSEGLFSNPIGIILNWRYNESSQEIEINNGIYIDASGIHESGGTIF